LLSRGRKALVAAPLVEVVQLSLVINNLFNDDTVYWTTSTNGAATSAFRPRDNNYNSPARETVPVGFGLKTPINFNLSAAIKL